jgi:hypothetical protein
MHHDQILLLQIHSSLSSPRQCQRAYLLLLCCSTAARLSFQLSFGSGNMIRTLRLAFLISAISSLPSLCSLPYEIKIKLCIKNMDLI